MNESTRATNSYASSFLRRERYPFFTDQFHNAKLNDKLLLDSDIDNISGATLSVNALKRQARLALLLDTEVRTKP